MPLGRKARGKATATQPWEAKQIFELGGLTKGDVFCDLGCGHGRVVIWDLRDASLHGEWRTTACVIKELLIMF